MEALAADVAGLNATLNSLELGTMPGASDVNMGALWQAKLMQVARDPPPQPLARPPPPPPPLPLLSNLPLCPLA